MNADELKLIMDAISTLGDQGKTAFIAWLIFDKLIPALCGLVASWVVGWVVLRIAQTYVAANASDAAMRRIRTLLMPRESGYLSLTEIATIEQTVHELVAESRGKNKKESE